jgi:hypothetical protein
MTTDTMHHVVTLAGAHTVRQAAQIHADMLAVLSGPGDILLDAAGMTEADLSVVQIIISAQRSAASSGRRLELAAPPAGALREALERGGFADPGAADPARWVGQDSAP